MAQTQNEAILKQMGETTLPAGIEDLRNKRQYMDQVIDYCEAAYVEQDKNEIMKQTIDYLEDALGAITSDVEVIASNLTRLVEVQGDVLGDIAEKTEQIHHILSATRSKRGTERLISEHLQEVGDSVTARQQYVRDDLKPQSLEPYDRLNLAERFAAFDDIGHVLIPESTRGETRRMSNPERTGGFGHARSRRPPPHLISASHTEDGAELELDGGGDILTPVTRRSDRSSTSSAERSTVSGSGGRKGSSFGFR